MSFTNLTLFAYRASRTPSGYHHDTREIKITNPLWFLLYLRHGIAMPNSRNIAVIDLGTNTFHLLIVTVEGTHYEIIHKEKSAVKIGEGGIDKNIITPEAQSRALDALIHFAKVIEVNGVEEIKATATSAFRNAKNGAEVASLLTKETGIPIQIIPGDTEAQLIYEGVSQAVTLAFEKSLIMDIGGGSVEFIICDNKQVHWKQSFEVGGQRLMNRFHTVDPIPEDQITALQVFLREKLHDLGEAIKIHNPKILIGASGSFDTLCEIYHKRNNMLFVLDKSTEYRLPIYNFHQIIKRIIEKNREDRLKIDGMIEMRVNMIVVACILIEFVTVTYGIKEIRSSTYALKEGLLQRIIVGEDVVVV